MGLPCHWRKSTKRFFSKCSFPCTKSNVCPSITPSWRTAWSSSWRRTLPSPNPSSWGYSSFGPKRTLPRKSCFLTSWRRFWTSLNLQSLEKLWSLYLNSWRDACLHHIFRYHMILIDFFPLIDSKTNFKITGCRTSALLLEQWVYNVPD